MSVLYRILACLFCTAYWYVCSVPHIGMSGLCRILVCLSSPGEEQQICDVSIIDDVRYEGAETLELLIITAGGEQLEKTAVITITDEEDRKSI